MTHNNHATRAMTITCAASLLLAAAACGGEEADLATDYHSSTAAVTEASGAAAALAAPLTPETVKLYAERATATAEQARKYVEAAYAAYQPCASFSWNGGLSGVITFTNCKLDATGQTIDGALGVTIKIRPDTVITLSFTKLEVGGKTYDGSLVLTVSGQPLTTTLEADMTYASADGQNTVTLDDMTVTRSGGSTTIDGQGSVQRDGVSTSFSAKGLTWAKGDCLPSDGTLTLTQQDVTVLITFLATTPDTGVVQVQVGNLPAKDVKLFTPCA